MRVRVQAAFATEFEHAIAQAAQKLAVMRHEHHRPLEAGERLEQHLLGGQVEIVGWPE
jgi:hypothetical protein